MATELSDKARLSIEYRPIGAIKPYSGNARKHPKAQIAKIAKSLNTFGWTNPLIVDDDDNLLCGHGRLEAAKLNKAKQVPVVPLSHLSEADRKAYIIADNRLAEEAQWSKRTLKNELSGLIELGYEPELTGFDTIEIDTVLAMDDEEPDEEEVQLPSDGDEPVSQLGDLVTIAKHRILVGDARDPRSYEALMQGERAELVITDPPYGCAIENNVSGGGKVKHTNFVMGAGETDLNEFAMTLLRPAFRQIVDHSKPGAIAFVFIDWRGAPYLYDAAKGIFHEAKNLIVWAKTNGGQGAFYRSAHELIYAFKVSAGRHINNFGLSGRYRTNVWTYPGANTFRAGRMQDLADHPTVKPKKMIADAILDCSKRGGIVLDPFLGSGTTLCAAEQTGRVGYGIELDPKYADVAIRRLAKDCGAVPMIGDKTFEEIAAQRSKGAKADV
ncbi:MAG: DNA methyltransferase [Pseudomonadota bacterium]